MSDTGMKRDPRMRWVLEDGYRQQHRLVADDGLIVGEVSGCAFNLHEPWTALGTTADSPRERLGEYLTLAAAKAAVEAAAKKKGKKVPAGVRKTGGSKHGD